MAAIRITYRKQALKALMRMQPKRSRAIREALEMLAEDPARRDIDTRPLSGRHGHRLRSGEWRMIFEIGGNRIDVLRVSPRGDAYKD